MAPDPQSTRFGPRRRRGRSSHAPPMAHSARRRWGLSAAARLTGCAAMTRMPIADPGNRRDSAMYSGDATARIGKNERQIR